MSNENIPSGAYTCTLVPAEDGAYRYPIVPGRQGDLCVELKLYLWAKNAEQPFAEIKSEQCIDAAAPARATSTDKTPYDFMLMSLRALGAPSDQDIDAAVINGLASEEREMAFPGMPKAATCEIAYKAGNLGGSFMNEKIKPLREVTDDARSRAIEAAKARKARTAPAASPFASAPGRGTPIAPPGARQPAR
jgi:hypothetical protein